MDSSGEISDKKVEEEQKKELGPNQKICLVCGDKALGYNFNAISCESCKAFFRRNALTGKEFKCPFTNNCDVTVVTRRFCQKCRLEKCLAIGMVKEFIMSDEDKAEKRRKIEENRAKKRQRDPEEDISSSKLSKRDDDVIRNYTPQIQEPVIQYDVLNSTTCSPTSTVQSPLSNDVENSVNSPPMYSPYVPVQSTEHPYTMKVYPMEEKTQYMVESYNMCDSMLSIDSNMYEPPKQNTIRSILTNGDALSREAKPLHMCEELPSTSTDPDINKARDILQDVERIEPNSMESILCEAIKLEFEAYPSVKTCSGSSRELNEVERAKLNELIVANKALNAPIDDDVSQLIDATCASGLKEGSAHDPRLVTIVNLTAVAIRRFIKMAKKINAFKNMCEEDQVALLKGGCIEMMILRSTMTYDGQRNQWKVPHSQDQFAGIRTDVLKLAKGNIYRSHESFIRSFEPRWRNDEHLILITCAILLFAPDRPRVVHKDVIKLEQSSRDIYRSHDSFIRSFEPRWRNDEHLILITCAILLFAPDRPRVVHKDVIKLEQNSYYYLLRRYLESVYPGCEAKSTFLKLIQKILELRKLAEEVTGVYLDVNPLEPLLMEIFDLKHHVA